VLYGSTFHLRRGHALRWPWLVKGIMYEAVEEEGHDQHPASEESQKVLPPQQVQQENQKPHIQTSQLAC
jgi:hypothetical protein